MSLRRWLISRYDFTGIAGLFYRSWKVELGAVLAVALLTAVGLLYYGFKWGGGDLAVFHGEKAFLPASAIHAFDWALGGTFLAVLIVNCARMWRATMLSERSPKVPVGAYLRHLLLLPVHLLTQKRYGECEQKRPWALHLALALGYLTMLVLILFFLEQMQSGPAIDWRVHAFGYLATAGLVAGTFYALASRVSKERSGTRFSHGTDWMFLVLLIVVVVTGVAVHALHRLELPVAANVGYVVHMMAVVPWLARYPFSKWSHLAYRPLAMYFASMQAEAILAQQKQQARAPGVLAA